MEQSHTFINVTPHRAKVRHQHTRRKLGSVKPKHQRKSSTSRQLETVSAYSTPPSVGEDVEAEIDVGEVLRSNFPSNSQESDTHPMPLRLYHQQDLKIESVQDIFPAVGNIDISYYVETYQSRRSGVPRVLDYYLRVAGPTAMWRPQLIDGDPEAFKRSFFQLSMKEPIIFEAVVAISQAHLDLSQHPGRQPSTTVLQHRGKVLRMLQASLMSSLGPDVQDTALMAVFCMLVLDIMYADWASVEANMRGFRHLASLRGGIDNLGWSGWFRTCFSWAELRWAGHVARVSSTTKTDAKIELPSYPKHPFSPATCLSISKLPEGLREGALKRELSTEVITFLEQVQEWTTEPQKSCAEVWTRQPLASFLRSRNDYLKSLHISVQGADILGKYALKPSERLLCIGVIAYIVSADGSIDDGRQPRGLDDHMVGMKALCIEMPLCDHLLWAGLAIATSTDGVMAPLSNHWLLLDRVLELDTRNDYREWKDVQRVLRKYFWNPFIEAKWKTCWQTALSRKLDRNK